MTDTLTRERDEILAALQATADPKLEPGTFRRNAVLHRGDDELPVQMVTKELISAGYCYMYDTKTGERSLTNLNMLPAQLRKKHESDGTPMFTTKEPVVKPVRGKFKCLLHADDPNRELYASWGFAACPKANLKSPHEVERHMQNRHRVEWATIRQEREKIERMEDKRRQEEILLRLADGKATRAR